jgi:hypothetical protein
MLYSPHLSAVACGKQHFLGYFADIFVRSAKSGKFGAGLLGRILVPTAKISLSVQRNSDAPQSPAALGTVQ